MWKYSRCFALVLAGTLMLSGRAGAEQVRFRFVPVDAAGNTRQVPIGPDGALGEKITGLGLIPRPFRETYRPTHMATYVHPFSGRCIIVPIAFPRCEVSRPVIRPDRVIYHYSHYRIEVRFLPDCGVDVIYKSCCLHPMK